MTPEALAKALPNIGVKTAKQLIHAGIDTPEKLAEMGAKEAYLRIGDSGGGCGTYHAAYLYALWGAIHHCDWLHIPEEKKREFKAFTKTLRDQ
jgi:DNA transformation protein and related proteins